MEHAPARRLALIAVLLAALAPPATAFDVQRHAAMTGEVLSSLSVPLPVTLPIVLGAADPDLAGYANGYCAPAFFPPCPPGVQPNPTQIGERWTMQHFDSNHIWPAFGGIDWVNFLVSDARGRIASWTGSVSTPSAYYAFIEVGMAMHAVQDFYAHSNYLEFKDRLFTRVDQIPIWDGIDLGGSTTIPPRSGSGLDLEGIQTGYFLLSPPGGATTHEVLNKDNPGTPEGAAIWQNILFQNRATYYQVASGQTAISQAYTAGGGVAPRHTERVWQSLQSGIAVFNGWPLDGAPEHVTDLEPQIAAIAADTGFAALGREANRLRGLFDGTNIASYPDEALDSLGMPVRFATPAHDVWAEWSGIANPAGAWRYGWSDVPGSTFTPHDVHAVTPEHLATWTSVAGGTSRVAASPVDSVTHEGGATIPAGTLSLTPGAAGQRAVVRWVAPASGTYDVTARFLGHAGTPAAPLATSTVQVYVNGVVMFADSLGLLGNPNAAAWHGTPALAAGAAIDFVVGDGGNGATNDATGLHVFIVPSATSGVPDGARETGLALAPVAPNPGPGRIATRFTLPAAGWVDAAVHDLAGREIARLASGPFEAGTHALDWAGRMDAGGLARPGVYFLRVTSGSAQREQRFVIVR